MSRQAFREHALDGALLYFQPASGVHVRIATAATAALRRRAPRVAMFGITNACNLACDFCSRDVARPSAWTVETAAAALRGLCEAGTLEVAYGGGEPFAFRGFAELVAELDATTALAQHVTTNGTLIRDPMWRRFAGRFGMVRLSIYDGTPWTAAAATLSAHGQRWGANVLVDRPVLDRLPALLASLVAAGCHDVSLLSYVGPDAARHLDAAGDRRLAAVIATSPLPCRVSVCFGDRLAVPRLFVDDCGAGRDFVAISPDRRVQSYSFQDRSLPGATAEEILAAWRLHQPALAAPSPRRGCARVLPLTTAAHAPPPPIAIWQAFSGNNSGECFLVARFRELADAERYLAELRPGWTPEQPHSPAWRTLFAEQRVACAAFDHAPLDAPRELLAIGRTVLAVHYDAEDCLCDLRALATKRGAFVVPGGVHVHDQVTLLAAIGCRDELDRARLLAAPAPPDTRLYPHGDVVLATIPILARGSPLDSLAATRAAFLALAGERPFAVEIYFDELAADAVVAAKRHLGDARAAHPRLWLYVFGQDHESRLAQLVELCGADRTTRAGHAVLVDPAPDRKRLAVLAHRRGAASEVIDGEDVEVGTSVWLDPPPPRKGRRAEPRVLDVARFEADLRGALPRGADLAVTRPDSPSWRRDALVRIATSTPAPILATLDARVAAFGARHSPWVRDRDPLGAALRRLIEDV